MSVLASQIIRPQEPAQAVAPARASMVIVHSPKASQFILGGSATVAGWITFAEVAWLAWTEPEWIAFEETDNSGNVYRITASQIIRGNS